MGDLDASFRALADNRRRIVLTQLLQHNELTLADLAELVIEQERGEPVTAVSDERVRDLYLTLYHSHLPVLEESGLVRYEQELDLVAKTERTESLLRRVQETVTSLRSQP